ncbi:MAG: transcriptional regulator [Xanthomonadaceae bacterium]|nr:transcriptional regulator [Xanthomonadaceae bacterium]
MTGGRKTASKQVAPAVDADPAAAGHDHRHAVVMRLKRVEGQIRGVLAMIDSEASCDAVAQQLAAARKALDRAFYEMMACDFEQEIVRSSDTTQLAKRLAEKTRLLAKYG